MKGINGMLAVAKAMAIEKCIRGVPSTDGKIVYGYMLKADELHTLFRLNGFRKVETERSYIKTWVELGYVVKVEWRGHSPVFFFLLQAADVSQICDLMQCKQDNLDERNAETCVYVGTEVSA